MPSNNFLQFNPGQANQESDSTYSSDTNRSGGFPVDAIWPSPLANKTLYQLSTMVAALATFITNRGYNAQDTSLPTLITNLTSALLSGASQLIAVAYAAAMAFAASGASITVFETTLTGNVTSSTLTGVNPGNILIFVIHQNSGGGHTFVWPTGFGSAGVVDPTGSATSTQQFVIDGSGNPHPLGPMTSS